MAGISTTPIATDKPDRPLARFDLWLLVSALILLGFGLMSLYSLRVSGRTEDYFRKQIVFIALGMVPFFVFYFIHPKAWQRLSNVLYITNLILLALVLVIGSSKGGAQRWIEIGGFQFQPSEIAKLLTALTVASFWANRIEEVKRLSTFLLSFVHVIPPMILVFKQPHLGATLVILITWLAVCVGAGVPLKFVFGSAFVAILLLVSAFFIPGALDDYQKNRIMAMFIHDEKGKSFQTNRAEVAFGIGGINGVGFGKGELKTGGFVPEQQNDFVLSIIGEEGGLIGSTLVLFSFGFFFYRAWLVMFRASDDFFKMAAAGILGMLAFHAIANMGMNLKLLPVVGLWLPFMSSGGTAIWLCMSCVALLLNMRRHERPVLF